MRFTELYRRFVDAFTGRCRLGAWALASLGTAAVQAAAGPIEKPDVVVAVPDVYVRNVDNSAFVASTLAHLNRAIDSHRFVLHVVPVADLTTQLMLLKPDFLIAPAGLEVFVDKPIAAFRLATRKSPFVTDASQACGSVIVTLRERDDIGSLADLRGKVVAGGLPGGINTWLAAVNEIEKAGFNSDSFFKETFHLFDVYPDLVSALWGRSADAVVLPACALESLEAAGIIAMDEVKVVNDRTDALLACRRSSDLFPDYGFVGFDWTDKTTAQLVTVGLLTYDRPEEANRWVPYVSHERIQDLYRNLRIGPFAYLRDASLKALYRRYPNAFHFGALTLLLLLSYGVVLQILVRRKTAALRLALARQRRSESQARRQRLQLGHLERRNVVNQMSGMIAHEIKSPVGAIRNFTAVLSILLPDDVKTNPDVQTALTSIDGEAQHIAGIVDRVRSYAKSQKMAHVSCDLVAIARKAVAAMKLTGEGVVIRETYQTIAAPVFGDPLELELLILNLLRNAAEVTPAAGVRVPRIDVAIVQTEDERWQVRVSDQGETLSDEAFARLTRLVESVKPEGLGMGLSIIRGIADSHAAAFEFVRNASIGLTAVVTLAKFQEKPYD